MISPAVDDNRKTFSFCVEGRLDGMNDIIRHAAYNRYGGGARRKAAKEKCYWSIITACNGQNVRFTNAVVVSFAWIEPNGKRDPDGIIGGSKVILDALVMAQIIPNDTRQWIKGLSHTFPPPDKVRPRIEVQVTEA